MKVAAIMPKLFDYLVSGIKEGLYKNGVEIIALEKDNDVDLKKIFKKGIHLEWFSTSEEFLSLIKYYLENETIREKNAYQGCKFVHENFTFRKNNAENYSNY